MDWFDMVWMAVKYVSITALILVSMGAGHQQDRR